jgi:hypothetical protein
VELTLPPTLEAAALIASLAAEVWLAVLPMILSLAFVIAVRVRRARRCTIRGGLSFSVSAPTSALSSRCVCWISPRIWSGSLVIGFSLPAR